MLKSTLRTVVSPFVPFRFVFVSAVFFVGVVFGVILAPGREAARTIDVRVTVTPVLSGYAADSYGGSDALVCYPYDNSLDRSDSLEGITPALYSPCPPGSLRIFWNNEPYCELRFAPFRIIPLRETIAL